MFILNFCAIILKKARWGKIKDRILKDFLFCCLVISILGITLARLDYRARENDSRLYTKFLQQITQKPLAEMVVVNWEQSAYIDHESPYVRDHLIGQFIVPFLMVRMGVPAKDALYLFNSIVQMGWIFLLFYLIYLTTGNKYYEMLILAMLLPQSWVYILRANHEQPLLFCALLAIIAGIKLRNDWRWLLVAIFAIIWSFLIKGLGFVMVPVGFGLAWLVYGPQEWKSKINKLFLFCIIIAMSLLIVAWSYEQWFYSITGESFFKRYWEIQIVGRSLKPEHGFSLGQKLQNFNYYFSRVLAYALPWTLIAIIVGIKERKQLSPWLKNNILFLTLLLGYSIVYCLLFGQFSRRASRYVFPAYFIFYGVVSHFIFSFRPQWQFFSNGRIFRNLWYRYSMGLWLILHLLALLIYYAKGGYGYWER